MTSALQLRQDVLDELEFEPSVNAAHIGVVAEQGVVTLTGYVNSYPQKLSAITAARRVKGVQAIADEIEVRYPSDVQTADDEIARRASDVLRWDSVLPGGLQVLVRDGWITLTGSVDWYYHKMAAEGDVRNLAGVRGVINNIEIKPRVKAENIRKKIEDALKRHAEVEAKAIKVIVRDDSSVVLEGKVDNWEERHAVEQAAWAVAGVRSVEDRLKIS